MPFFGNYKLGILRLYALSLSILKNSQGNSQLVVERDERMCLEKWEMASQK